MCEFFNCTVLCRNEKKKDQAAFWPLSDMASGRTPLPLPDTHNTYKGKRLKKQCLDPDPDSVSSQFTGGQKSHTKIEKCKEISCFEVLYVLFWGLKASPVA
jgi:hypothetical protein